MTVRGFDPRNMLDTMTARRHPLRDLHSVQRQMTKGSPAPWSRDNCEHSQRRPGGLEAGIRSQSGLVDRQSGVFRAGTTTACTANRTAARRHAGRDHFGFAGSSSPAFLWPEQVDLGSVVARRLYGRD